MVNSILIANEFHDMLPTFFNPAFTENYEGFNHLNSINGNVEKTIMHYIIRNHDMQQFEKQKQDFKKISNFLNDKYGVKTCEVQITDSYFNMSEHLKDHMEIVEIAKKATIMAGITPVIEPIRGGTDGAVLTYKGLMCPNLGTGGYNFHGRYECITIEGMEKATEILLNIINIVTNDK
jgi:tripeptide aminopeptidase